MLDILTFIVLIFNICIPFVIIYFIYKLIRCIDTLSYSIQMLNKTLEEKNNNPN